LQRNRDLPVNRGSYRLFGLAKSVLVSLMILSAAIGFASAWVVAHGTESGAGTHTTGSLLSFWTETNSTVGVIPTTVPTLASTTSSAPTRLASSSAGYSLNTATAGDQAVDWWFSETTSAPVNTELELNLILTIGVSPGTQSTFEIYFETRATAPSSTILFMVYYDGGASAVAFDSSEAWTNYCPTVGSCP
jgi:hypothetical protein